MTTHGAKVSTERSPSRRRVVALGALWLAVSAGAIAAPGCYGRNCQDSYETYGAEPGQGMMVDENTWESNKIDEPWLSFPRKRYYIFDLRALGGRIPREPLPLVSAASDPLKGGNDFTIGSGNLVKFYNLSPNRIDVKNDTCSDYYLHLQVEALPFPPAPTAESADAGAENAISSTDAGADDEDAAP